MRLSTLFMRLGAFALAGLGCATAANVVAALVEDRSVMVVREVLLDEGHHWTSVQGDGLQIILEGEAPSEAVRFRARSAAGSVVDSSRVIDNMRVAESEYDTAPEFAIEFLRNEKGVSLIGLMPASTDRADVTRRIARLAGGAEVVDFLDAADYPAPASWRRTLNFALKALELLPRSKISLTPTEVRIRAISESEAQKASWEAELRQQLPEGLALRLRITAPRPVITPFTVRFIKRADGAEFDACSADTEETQAVILAAAAEAGVPEGAECVLGLGVPSKTWGAAVAQSIRAVNALGGGTLTISDGDVRIEALEGTEAAVFDDVIGKLQNGLPGVFSLSAELPLPPDPGAAEVPQFTITRSPEGLVQLRGRIADELMNQTAENYAKARFGHENVDMGTRILADNLPAGWPVRVLAGVEAMSYLASGAVIVRPDDLSVRGRSGTKTASADVSRLLIDKLGQTADFTIDIVYEERLDPIAALPTPEECVAGITAVTDRVKITFEPGSSNIVAAGRGALDDIADVLRKCPELELQIAGYTDSQGGDQMNQRLSQKRAEAVLRGLRLRRVPTSSFTARGFGEENPIASNDTEEGREANRRIEFTLMAEAQAAEAEAAAQTEAPATPVRRPEPRARVAPDQAQPETADE